MSLYRRNETNQGGRINKLEDRVNNYFGTSSDRPKVGEISNTPFFDTTIKKPIWWNGTEWVDAAGGAV